MNVSSQSHISRAIMSAKKESEIIRALNNQPAESEFMTAFKNSKRDPEMVEMLKNLKAIEWEKEALSKDWNKAKAKKIKESRQINEIHKSIFR
jgi:hypothetical protein